MRLTAISTACLAAACTLASVGLSTGAGAAPQRIVSLNLCVDQILIDLVEPSRIAALSFLATDEAMSAVAGRANAFKRVHGTAEEVLALDPDLVIMGKYSTPATRALLTRLGKNVLVVDQPATVAAIAGLVRKLAGAVGARERGEALITALTRRVEAARPKTSDNRPTALALQVNSITSMPGSLLDDMFEVAGLQNAAPRLAQGQVGRVALETLVASPPDILVYTYSRSDFQTVLADNLRHPVLEHLRKDGLHVALPMWSTLCATPHSASAVEALAKARRRFLNNDGAAP